jgi:cobalamin synthase
VVVCVNPGRGLAILRLLSTCLLGVFLTIATAFKQYVMPEYMSPVPHPVWLAMGVAFILLGTAWFKKGSEHPAYNREKLGIIHICIGCLLLANSFGAYYVLIAMLVVTPLIIITLFREAFSRLAKNN